MHAGQDGDVFVDVVVEFDIVFGSVRSEEPAYC